MEIYSSWCPTRVYLGHLLFVLYINEIVADVGSNIRVFADDTSLFIIVDNPIKAAENLSTDLDIVSQWAATWLVTFNPNKTEALLFFRKQNRLQHPPLIMQNQHISEVDCHKLLGLYFTKDCSWHQHINYIKEKAWLRINIMKKLKIKLDRKSLETIYLTFIRPLPEYGDVIWDNCTQYEKDELDKIQNETARIVTGTKLVSINSLYNETCSETLERRRYNHKITLFYKMMHNITPLYLSSLVPQSIGNLSL